jgi:DNA-binding MarR family transcriptional regulator
MRISYQEADISGNELAGRVEATAGYQLKRAQHLLRLAMDAELRPLGLTTPQYAVLSALETDAGLSGAELARRAFVTPQTMQALIVGLEGAGFLIRRPHATHGRILRAFLTSTGSRVLSQAHGVVSAIHHVMLATLSPPHRKLLVSLLRECGDRLERPEADEPTPPNSADADVDRQLPG